MRLYKALAMIVFNDIYARPALLNARLIVLAYGFVAPRAYVHGSPQGK